jgi:hypothetical protein
VSRAPAAASTKFRRAAITTSLDSVTKQRPAVAEQQLEANLDNHMHQCSRLMDISVLLTLFTSFVVLKTISYHSRLIKASFANKESLHLGSQLMSTTNSFMNVYHSQPRLIRTQTLKK